LVLALGVFSISCESQDSMGFSNITKDQLQSMLKDGGIQLVDVRTDEEVSEGMIEGALHIDIHSDTFADRMKALDQSKPIVIYCKSGGRSSRAASNMVDWGYKEVYNLEGGYDGWAE
jgi:rhodanese-related sulfurtransferase